MDKNRKYWLSGGFTADDIEKMHSAMLDVVENVGLNIQHDGILRELSGIAGVNISGENVMFSADLVEKAISQMQYPDYVKNADYLINQGAYEMNVLDLETGEIRPSTTKDLVEMVKLSDSYGMYGSSPVRPQDIKSTELQEVTMYKLCWENGPRISNSIFEANEKSSVRVAEYVYEMSKIADKRFSLGFWIKSPFRTDFRELDIIYRFLDKGVPMWVATMPIAGATAPVYMVGAYVQSMAELFAGLTMLGLINTSNETPHCLIIDSIRAYAFDMRYASFVYGTPDDIIGTIFQAQLNKRYGIPLVAKSLMTSAKFPDAQLGVELASHTLAAALSGARIFTGGGFLSVDEVYSGEKLVLDYEIVQHVKNIVEGFEFSDKDLSLDIIKEVGIGGSFISHDSTLDNYKEAFWIPDVFDRTMLGQWKELGSPRLKDVLRKAAKKRIEEHSYEMDRDVKKELEKIFRKAVEEFGS
ncbi:MAG: trimethylamine methyltransferase family protein [Actinobacteria bacterium]|nr:trimethylamine methyltransferase family protein [Actinomycetota bacterium]